MISFIARNMSLLIVISRVVLTEALGDFPSALTSARFLSTGHSNAVLHVAIYLHHSLSIKVGLKIRI